LGLGACGGGGGSGSTPAGSKSACGYRDALRAIQQEIHNGAKGAGATQHIDQFKRDLQATVDRAPAEIKSDVQTVVNAGKTSLDVLASVNFDFSKLQDPAVMARLQAASKDIGP